ncbi:MAG: trypsin-like peptidase domain-containing protein [Chitinophagaceae bacterium]|nr:trypsin-like peptidase domain-containing protein [Chitinophagaceae bacterium]
MKKIISIFLIAFTTSLLTFAFGKKFILNNAYLPIAENEKNNLINTENPKPLNISTTGDGYTNLEYAAELSQNAVVHITTESKPTAQQNPFGGDDFFSQFFGRGFQMQPQPQSGSGSGVVISADGYIVTNNHVVQGADEVSVTFNNKNKVTAKVIGTDASTDLAVLKVEEKNLTPLKYGNSDDVKLGQWVLAVGYPLNLEITVTAGIVSAKYRNIGINQRNAGQNSIESFIQTDAAVNPGNSGGALVNANGELIGINSAIASPTGSYAGYSYAIPSNLVKKVVADLMKFGNVQRAFLGISYLDTKNAPDEKIKELNLDKINGVYVGSVSEDGAAEDAGIQEGDIITKIGENNITRGTELLERIAQYAPGDKVNVAYLRNGKTYNTTVTLKNKMGNTKLVNKDVNDILGANFKELSAEDKARYKSKGGVMITDLGNGLIAKKTNIRRGFVITEVNDKKVFTLNDLNSYFTDNQNENQINLAGFYPGYQGMYYYNFLMK